MLPCPEPAHADYSNIKSPSQLRPGAVGIGHEGIVGAALLPQLR